MVERLQDDESTERARMRRRSFRSRSSRAVRRLGEASRVIGEIGPAAGLPTVLRHWNRLGQLPGRYERWIESCEKVAIDPVVIGARIAALRTRPVISIVMPVYNPDPTYLRLAIQSVRRQYWTDWQLCIANDASPDPRIAPLLEREASADPRISLIHRPLNGNICAASNSALDLATGPITALMDHDDLLPPHALAEIVFAFDAAPDTCLVYSDEDKVDEIGRRFDPYFKPDFSYTQLLGQNLTSHLSAYRTDLLREIGGFRLGYEGSQDHDLALRYVARCGPERIVHVPKILYHWRQPLKSRTFSQSQLDKCLDAARRSLADHLNQAMPECGTGTAKVEESPIWPIFSRIRWPLPEKPVLISLIILSDREDGDLADWLCRLRRSVPDLFEVEIVLSHSGDRPSSDVDDAGRTRSIVAEANASAAQRLNRAAREARGAVLVFIADGLEPTAGDWLAELAGQLARPAIGIVGGRIVGEHEHLIHVGYRLADRGPGTPVAHSLHDEEIAGRAGYFGNYAVARDVSAVSSACLAIRAETFDRLGGFDERNFPGDLHDVDLCLRARDAGLAVIATPFASFRQAAHSRPAISEAEAEALRSRHSAKLRADPFYSMHFSRDENDWQIDLDCAAHSASQVGRQP